MIVKLGRKALMKFVDLLDKGILPRLATRATMSVIHNFEKKMGGSGAVAGALKTGKGTALMDLDRLKDRFIGVLLAPIAASLIRNVLG